MSSVLFEPLLRASRSLIARLPGWQITALGQAGWVTASALAQQVLRLAANIALARILAPEILGLMVVINTLRTAAELLTDIGTNQSIVQNPEGRKPSFYNTAWTMQIGRGLFLFIAGVAMTLPIASFYENEQLVSLIPVAAAIFLASGLASPAISLLQKDSRVRKIAKLELLITAISVSCNVGMAFILRDIWGLLLGLLISNIVSTAISYIFLPGLKYKITLNKSYMMQILHFGKWLFFSSVIFFISSNFDRLYFAKAIPLSMLGIYGIARTYADSAWQLVQRASHLIVFPRIAASPYRGAQLKQVISRPRGMLLLAVAVALAVAIVFADTLITLLYDARYQSAALMLPVLLIAAWFATLAILTEAIALGIGRPSLIAIGNLAKLLWIVATVPLVLGTHGFLVALGFLAVGDLMRYLTMTLLKTRDQLSFLRQDVVCTSVFALTTFALLQIVHLAGFSTSFGKALGIGA